MDIEKLIDRLRTESLFADKASLEIIVYSIVTAGNVRIGKVLDALGY